MGNYIGSDSTLVFHFVSLTLSWYGLANIAIIAVLFKHTIFGYYTHAFLAWIIVCLSLVSPLLYLIPGGVQGPCDPVQSQQQGQQCDKLQYTHNIIGTMIVFYIGLQAILGFLTRIFQQNQKISIFTILGIKKYHQFFGYILVILAKFNSYLKWRDDKEVWIPLAMWDVICFIVYVKFKWFSQSFQKSIVDQRVCHQSYGIKKIKNLGQLENGKLGYIIFANYVYDFSPLTTLHPAGYQIIKPARGREVDRFLYGMYASQGFSNIGTFSHPKRSLMLLGQPVAQLNIQNLYSSMQQTNQCEISESSLISPKNDIYLFKICLINKSNLSFSGYKEINQIGGYFSLTLKNTTRLYTKVCCLRTQNINLMKKIIQSNPVSNLKNNKKRAEIIQKINQNRNANYSLAKNDKQTTFNEDSIPLLVKIYIKGQLTPNLIFNQKKCMKISCQRGQGLQLDTLRPGKLIFIAGGTGFYPFIDLVDLLFKRCILNSHQIDQNLAYNILKNDSIIKSNFFQNFEFKFYIGVHTVQDLHPITIYQLYYLNSLKYINCIFKLHYSQSMPHQYQDFQLTSQYFHDFTLQDILNQKTSKTFICGPPVMLQSFADLFKKNNVQRSRYQFV